MGLTNVNLNIPNILFDRNKITKNNKMIKWWKQILIFNKASFGTKGFKYFIGYKIDNRINPFCITLPKMFEHEKRFAEVKYIPSLIIDDKLLKIYKQI